MFVMDMMEENYYNDGLMKTYILDELEEGDVISRYS
jgi:hypothetical protein